MRKIYGYARVSTKEQHLDRQIKALLDCGVEERDIVTDKASGASLERPGYQALKHTMLREGDTLVFKSLDRLSRNKEHISQELRYFKEHHIQVRVIDLPTTMIQLPKSQEWVFEISFAREKNCSWTICSFKQCKYYFLVFALPFSLAIHIARHRFIHPC